MGKGQTYRNDLIKLYFHGTAIASIADNSSVPFTSHIIALHTADPGSGGSQLTNETGYTGYARKAVPRNSAGWTITGNVVSPTVDIEFDKCTASPGPPLTHWSISRGGGTIDYSGSLQQPVIMATQVKPVITTASTVTEE
ncbi:MAG: hypothetical protein OEY77_00195 [Nitrospira sp.]|nr:hypothetical protein [Nitrospira sp.]